MLKLQLVLLLLLHLIPASVEVYGRVPGERYLDFLKTLTEDKKAVARGIIFDPHLTKDQARQEMEDWVHNNETPLTMQAYDRSQMDYEVVRRRNERVLNRSEKTYSEEGHRLDATIRQIYNNGSLTERQACNAATNAMKITRPETLEEVQLDVLDCEQIFTSIFD